MFRTLFRTALRNLLKRKWFTLLNVVGLGVSLTACGLIFLYVQDELSYDRFYPDPDNLYRVGLSFTIGEEDYDWPESSALLAREMQDNFPSVASVTTVFPAYTYAFRREEQVRGGFDIIRADSNFFAFFGYSLLHGNPNTALKEPHSLVLTESMARQYAATQPLSDLLGALLTNDGTTYQVTGIMADPPQPTHLPFDGVISIATLWKEHDYFMNTWQPNGVATYVRLPEAARPADLQPAFAEVERQYLWPQMAAKNLGVVEERLRAGGERYGYYLEPVADIHLVRDGYQLYVRLFSAVGLFILLIACTNFINLATAQATERRPEVGIRKVLGSSRRSLALQFLTEAMLTTAVATLLALLLVGLCLPSFNQLTDKQLSLPLSSPAFWIGIGGVIGFVGGLAGGYPAWVITAVSPIKALKGKFSRGRSGVSVRDVLIVGQFVITNVLIIGTGLVYRQSEYQRELNPGFDKENVLLIRDAYALGDRKAGFKQAAQQLSSVASVSYSYTVPGGLHDGNPVIRVKGQPEGHKLKRFNADEDYVPTLGLMLLEGRNFSSDDHDTASVLINQTAVRVLGLDEPIGEVLLDQWGHVWEVVGVIRDYHFHSLRHQVEPLLISRNKPDDWNTYVSVRYNDAPSAIRQLEELWAAQSPDAPFTYTFLDQQFDDLFRAEARLSTLGAFFTGLSVVLALLGLFGLTSYTTRQRTKEIGIRRVLGASVINLLALLSKDFFRLILIALAVAIPVANYLITEWLQNFAYHTAVAWWLFAGPAALVLLMALLSVSTQTLRAATRNPVDSLRDE